MAVVTGGTHLNRRLYTTVTPHHCRGVDLMTAGADLCGRTDQQSGIVSAMADMTGGAFPLHSRLMPTPFFPEIIYLLMTPQAQARFFATQIPRDSTAMRLVTCATALGGKGLMLICSSAGSGRGMTGKADLAFRLVEEKGIFPRVRLMAVVTSAALKGCMPVTRFIIRGGVFVALQT